jgi:hypothetical protein
MVAIAAPWYIAAPLEGIDRSTKAPIEAKVRAEKQPGTPLLVVNASPHSTKFYTCASYQRAAMEQVMATLERPGEVFVLLEHRDMTPPLKGATKEVAANRKFVLLRKR